MTTWGRRWANAKGNTTHRDVPVHEVCKSEGSDMGEGETEIRREWNSQARARPLHLGGGGGRRGLAGWRGGEEERRDEGNKSRDTKTRSNPE